MNEPLRKDFKALRGELADNRLRIVATVCGVPDRIGDVLMPGAFPASVLRASVEEGWLDMGHEWGEGYGMFTDAKMVGNELHIEAEFYDTEDSQRLRQKVKQRLDNGKKVSTSIGFMPDYGKAQWFNSGSDLLKWAKEASYDEGQLDAAAIKRLGMCRAIPAATELFELTICTVGMHKGARVTEAKHLTADEQFNEALDAFVLAIEREADIAAIRGRIGKSQAERLEKAITALEPLFKSEPAHEPKQEDHAQDDAARTERQRALLMRAAFVR